MRKTATLTATIGLLAAAAATAVAAPIGGGGGGGKPPPKITQLVVFKDGSFKERALPAHKVVVRVGRRRCVVGQATPLAALVVSRAARVVLRDYGTCSRRPRDAGGLFVRKLGRDANRGQDGWVYKVGRKAGSAGAADPSGPFGHGRLRYGAHVLWFYCHMSGGSCQRTLSFDEIDTAPPGGLVVHVSAYDDRGHGIPAAGVTVHVDQAGAVTDASGVAHVTTTAGGHRMYADGGGYVRTFDTHVDVQ
jgi:hypothetical protein